MNEGASHFIPRAGRRSLSRSICSQLSPQWRVVVRIVYKVPSTFTTVFRILIDYLEGGDTLDQFLQRLAHESTNVVASPRPKLGKLVINFKQRWNGGIFAILG